MTNFKDFALNPLLTKALTDMGIEKPTPIQAQAWPLLLDEPTDFLGLAATGTGKTLAFGLPLITKIDLTNKAVQSVVLCPTRELAMQVCRQLDLLGKPMGIRSLAVYGGAPFGDQVRGLRDGARIVVGTPGRIIDHIERGTLNLSSVQTVILDEADEMISMGFKDELETILSKAPRKTCNIWLFCATMERDTRKVADTYLRSPKQVQVNRTEIVPEGIDQVYYRVHENDKPDIVCNLIDAAPDFYGIIFCQTKSLVADLAQYLKTRNFKVDCLHGDMDQNARERTMQGFRDRRSTVLVCTDVASRGLDVKDMTHVINYSLPREIENYVHRIGRTARSGKTGTAISLVTPSHKSLIFRTEQITKSRMREGTLPSRKDVGTKKVSAILKKLQVQKAFGAAAELMDESWKAAISEMSKEEIVGRFIAMTLPDLFSERKTATHSSNYANRDERRGERDVRDEQPENRTSRRARERMPYKGHPRPHATRPHADRSELHDVERSARAEGSPRHPKSASGKPAHHQGKPAFKNHRGRQGGPQGGYRGRHGAPTTR